MTVPIRFFSKNHAYYEFSNFAPHGFEKDAGSSGSRVRAAIVIGGLIL